MYIFELMYKIVKNITKKRLPKEKNEEEQSDEKCEHIFLPIDSTKEILACSKCGKLVKTKDLKSQ